MYSYKIRYSKYILTRYQYLLAFLQNSVSQGIFHKIEVLNSQILLYISFCGLVYHVVSKWHYSVEYWNDWRSRKINKQLGPIKVLARHLPEANEKTLNKCQEEELMTRPKFEPVSLCTALDNSYAVTPKPSVPLCVTSRKKKSGSSHWNGRSLSQAFITKCATVVQSEWTF
jgi:hypothetical protein